MHHDGDLVLSVAVTQNSERKTMANITPRYKARLLLLLLWGLLLL